jgi:hypothetical protein
MILPDFVLPYNVQGSWDQSGLDSEDKCLNKKHFADFPYPVHYKYNNRGYRDDNWPPIQNLGSAIWCVGDSFTVGIGSPREHTWTYVLQQASQQRCINVSMDGASNNWIARRTVDIVKNIAPKWIVVQWSYLHRRERSIEDAWLNRLLKQYQRIKQPQWPTCKTQEDFDNLPPDIKIRLPGKDKINDGDRLLMAEHAATVEQDQQNTLQCIDTVEQARGAVNVLHTFIPAFIQPDLELEFLQQVKSRVGHYLGPVQQLDYARDSHHYDIKTSQAFVEQVLKFVNLQDATAVVPSEQIDQDRG